MSISEILIISLVYGGLFIYLSTVFSTKNKRRNNFLTSINLKNTLLFVLYSFTISCVWSMFKAEEAHRNEHSGLKEVSLHALALLFIAGVTLYSLLLFLLSRYLITKGRGQYRRKMKYR